MDALQFFGNFFNYLLNLLTNLKWPLFLLLIIFNIDKLKKIIIAIKGIDLHLEIGGQKFKVNSTKIKTTLRERIKKLSLKADNFKPFPYASYDEYTDIVQIVRAMEFLGIHKEQIEDIAVLKCMGGYYYMIRDLDKSEQFFLRAKDILEKGQSVNRDEDIYTSLGYIYYSRKNFEKANSSFAKAKTINPTSAWSELGSADCYRESKDPEKKYLEYYDNALNIFKKQIKSNELNYMAHYGSAFVNWGIKDYTKAMISFSKATEINECFDIAYYNIAILTIKMNPKDVDGSVENLKKAISLNPEIKNWAAKDNDLNPIKENQCFKCLIR